MSVCYLEKSDVSQVCLNCALITENYCYLLAQIKVEIA